MSFRLDVAQLDDANQITQIHMDAFSSNVIIRAIHHIDSDLKDWRASVHKKNVTDIHDARTTVLVVRYNEADTTEATWSLNGYSAESGRNSGEVIGFAKWTHPFRPEDGYTPPPWEVPKSTDQSILRPWLDQVNKVQAEIIGQTPRYGKELTLCNMLGRTVQRRELAR
jgi:hypothetical protein